MCQCMRASDTLTAVCLPACVQLTGEHSNPNYQRFMADQTTGLMAAAYHGRQDIAMSLLDAGAVVDANAVVADVLSPERLRLARAS